ncbi:hypothetical protein BLOT_005903 [Blomia tropicalis]|nr:hypothetical protein BLOT_005903 [Blomia tropicalis]
MASILIVICVLLSLLTTILANETTYTNQSIVQLSSITNVSTPFDHGTRVRRAIDEIDILPEPYYRDIAPVIDGKPVQVKVSVVILNMKVSSGSDQSFDVDIFYHNYWNDSRLVKPSNMNAIPRLQNRDSLPMYKLSNTWRNRLWIPDTYFRNAIQGTVSNILTPTHYFTVKNYTQVFMAVRIALKLSCEMNFAKFPFDTQKCFINITTTSENNNTMVLDWHTFRIGSHVDVTEFVVVSVDKQTCTKRLDIGYYSCLYGEIVFKRNMGNYLIKRFIPSFIIVVMSFLGFWIPTNISPTRTILPITALLALITQQIQANLNVSYVYALQIWNIVCIVFVFANLLEYAIALYVMHMAHKRRSQKSTNAIENNQTEKEKTDEHHQSRLWKFVTNHFRTTSRSSAVDKISRYLFPLSYGMFIIIFTIYVSM